jgi:predicted Zn-dependent protease with MMP-like domain
MNADEFERMVSDAYDELPQSFKERIENVAIVVEDWPDLRTMQLAGVSQRAGLLGLYHGVPLTERTSDYGLVAPDKISIYRFPITMRASTSNELRGLVRQVLLHEIAHYFGIDDDRLHELGAY